MGKDGREKARPCREKIALTFLKRWVLRDGEVLARGNFNFRTRHGGKGCPVSYEERVRKGGVFDDRKSYA